MKNIYIVKHYWDEKSYGATLEPKWLFSSDNLNNEEREVKNIILEYTKLSKYNELALKKPLYEKKDNLYIYFCYKDKNDPDPTNNRKVTDITFIISPKPLKNPCKLEKLNTFVIKSKKHYLLFPIFFFLIIGILFFILYKPLKKTEQKEQIIAKKYEKASIKKEKKEFLREKQKTQLDLICEKYSNILNGTKRYQQYFKDICNKKTNLSYQQWLDKKNRLCKMIVENPQKDKELRRAPKELQEFIKNYKKE